MKDWVTFLGGNGHIQGRRRWKIVKFDVKFRNFESMTKKPHQKFWRMKRHCLGKVTWKSVTCEIIFLHSNKFSEIWGNASLTQGMDAPGQLFICLSLRDDIR